MPKHNCSEQNLTRLTGAYNSSGWHICQKRKQELVEIKLIELYGQIVCEYSTIYYIIISFRRKIIFVMYTIIYPDDIFKVNAYEIYCS